MVCNDCGAQVSKGATECPECGAKIAAPAPRKARRPQPTEPRTAPAKRASAGWWIAVASFIAGLVVGYLIFSPTRGTEEEAHSSMDPHAGVTGAPPMGGSGGMGGSQKVGPLKSDIDPDKLPPGHPDIATMMKAAESKVSMDDSPQGGDGPSADDGRAHGADMDATKGAE